MSSYCVYRHVFPNGKSYIGITSQTLTRRFNNGSGYKKCPKVYAAILKYGWNNVEHEMLFDGLTKQEAEAKEVELIAYYNSIENGYNIDHGGNVPGTHSVETRAKISAGNIGKRRPRWTEERRKAASAAVSGESNPFYGKHHSETVKKLHSDFMKGNKYNKGNHHTEDFKIAKSEQMKQKYANGGNPRCKSVIRKDNRGNEETYYSLRKAASVLGKSPASILSHIKSGKPLCGYTWRYE